MSDERVSNTVYFYILHCNFATGRKIAGFDNPSIQSFQPIRTFLTLFFIIIVLCADKTKKQNN